MKKILFLSFSLFSVLFVLRFPGDFPLLIETKPVIVEDTTVTIKFACVGDLMCHSPQFEYARVSDDSFDFVPVFREVRKYFEGADIVFGNFETVLASEKNKYSGYPFFNSPDDYAEALKSAGFNYLNMANNHSLDQKEKGLLRTIEVINGLGINYFGTYSGKEDRDSIRIFEKDGMRLAFLGYSYGTNGLPVPTGKDYLINLIKPELIKSDIAAAKKLNPDLIITYFHFGKEYEKSANTAQKEVVKTVLEAGGDIIIASHPHVLQPIELFSREGSKLDTGFVAYSLGNFISNQQWRYSDAGVVLKFELEKNKTTDKIKLKNLACVPTFVFKGIIGGKKEYLLIPSGNYADTTYTFLSKGVREKVKEAFMDSKEILTGSVPVTIISN
ncbi:MAG: CapA family protein [Ignavibacteriaceae bacterium]